MRTGSDRLLIKAALLLTLLPLCLVAHARAASFDCGKATTKTEKLICTDPELSILDEDLTSTYNNATKKTSDPATLKHAQRAWLKERNLCNDSSCLRTQYRQRLADLNQVLTGFPTVFPADISEFKIDCDKAQSKAEKIICKQDGSPLEQDWLAGVDKSMQPLLQWALMRSQDKQKIIEAQRQWQKQARDTCTDILSCVDVFSKRSMELQATFERPGQCYVLKPLSDDKDNPQLDADGNVQTIDPVCLAMEENLNQFCDQPPMVCGLQVAPRFRQQITFPEWSPLDPEANRSLIEEFFRAPWQDARIPEQNKLRLWEEERPKVEAALAAKRLTFSEARLDLFNVGKEQLTYRLDYGTCQADNQQLANKPDWTTSSKSAPIQIQHAPPIIRPLFQEYFPIGRGAAQEAFLFGGKTYTYWMMRGVDQHGVPQHDYPLYVNRHERWAVHGDSKVNLTEHNKCRFDYQPNQEESK